MNKAVVYCIISIKYWMILLNDYSCQKTVERFNEYHL